MSRNMQLTVIVRPYYEKDLEGTYPRLASYLSHLDPRPANQNPSLYELVGQLDQLLYRFDGTPLMEALLQHKDRLNNTDRLIQGNIADRHLAQADKLLYTIEDIFDEIESQLN